MLLFGISSQPLTPIDVNIINSGGLSAADILTLVISFAASIIIPLLLYTQMHRQFIAQMKRENRQLAVNTITAQRVNWIYELRNAVSAYTAVAFELHQQLLSLGYAPKEGQITYNAKEEQALLSILKDLTMYSQKVILLLNFKDDIDRVMSNCINEHSSTVNALLQEKYDEPYYNGLIDNLRAFLGSLSGHTQIYLKLEWNRIKNESQKETYTDEDYRSDRYALYEAYLNVQGSDVAKSSPSSNPCTDISTIIGVNELLKYWHFQDNKKPN